MKRLEEKKRKAVSTKIISTTSKNKKILIFFLLHVSTCLSMSTLKVANRKVIVESNQERLEIKLYSICSTQWQSIMREKRQETNSNNPIDCIAIKSDSTTFSFVSIWKDKDFLPIVCGLAMSQVYSFFSASCKILDNDQVYLARWLALSSLMVIHVNDIFKQ